MRDFLKDYMDFTNEEYHSFISISKKKVYRKNEFLLKAGNQVKKLFFVESGFMRGYRIEEGVEITHHFYLEKWLATDYESYLSGSKGELYIQAIVDTTVHEFEKDRLHDFYRFNPKFEKLRFVQAEDAYLQMVRRIKNFQNRDLKQRYLSLIGKNPELFQLVPHWQIASYLGVTPQSLSRIRRALI